MTPERLEALQGIEKNVCEQFGISPLALKSRRQDADMVDARTLFAVQARALEFSYPQIGKYIDRHHSTVIHYIRKVGGC